MTKRDLKKEMKKDFKAKLFSNYIASRVLLSDNIISRRKFTEGIKDKVERRSIEFIDNSIMNIDPPNKDLDETCFRLEFINKTGISVMFYDVVKDKFIHEESDMSNQLVFLLESYGYTLKFYAIYHGVETEL